MKKIAKFEKVSFEQYRRDWADTFGFVIDSEIENIYNEIKIPKRKTRCSAGHDICIPFNATIKQGETLKIPTGIRAKMDEDYVMLIFPRSSLGIKKGMYITNTIPVIDADYYEADNEGHIFLCIKNGGNKILDLYEGDAIVQAVFVPYGVADDEEITEKRIGGIGSTDKIINDLEINQKEHISKELLCGDFENNNTSKEYDVTVDDIYNGVAHGNIYN